MPLLHSYKSEKLLDMWYDYKKAVGGFLI